MSHLIVLSNPIDIENEHERIHSLFDSGLKCFHLRKPDKTKEELEAFLKNIKPKYYKSIVIHSHYSLIEKYNLKGVHFPERMLKEESAIAIVKPMQRYGFTLSGSVHSINPINEFKNFNYVFLSPVFDSISKEGYKSQIDLEEFKKYKNNHSTVDVIALGGITYDNVQTIVEAGFNGIALLGSVWNQDADKGLNEFIKAKLRLAELSNS